ncbi:MAG: hypothetical protein HYX90_02310 [Chloroflexi bacterium]|nr:hypothetical protein [Chloroflexota bacterium]
MEIGLDLRELLGLVGGALTTFSLFPQLVRLFKLKSAREISLYFTLLLAAGLGCWMAYGIVFGLFPIIFWNSIGLVLSLAMVIAKLKYDRKDSSPPNPAG